MSEWDVIVVGAGAAGAAVAGRLSEDPGTRVLLLEAGSWPRTPAMRIPAAFPMLLRSALDWGDTTATEPGLGGRSVAFPRGRAVGGSTAINAMMYVRGDRASWDAWREHGGDEWGADAMLAFARRAEDNARGADAFHGAGGPIRVEDLRDPSPLSHAFVTAAGQVGIRASDDLNGADAGGAAIVQVTQRRGRRVTAADGYLARRPNLDVRSGHHAVALHEAPSGRIDGVVVEARGRRQVLRARREVVLCAGAIGSPQLLMLSGIGPAEHLRAHGIGVRADLPGVGQNLVDHVLAPLVFAIEPPPPTLRSARSPRELMRYLTAHRGMLTSNVAEAAAFAGDLELVFAPVAWRGQGLEPPDRDAVTIGVVLLAPHSRGQVALRSPHAVDAPAIRPCYLADERDVARLADGARLARRIAAAPALRAFGMQELPPTANTDNLRAVAQTIYHPAGTCRIGTDRLAVVDPQLRVLGVEGLRVADASVLPSLPAGHPQAAVYAIGERAADLLRTTAAPLEERGRGTSVVLRT